MIVLAAVAGELCDVHAHNRGLADRDHARLDLLREAECRNHGGREAVVACQEAERVRQRTANSAMLAQVRFGKRSLDRSTAMPEFEGLRAALCGILAMLYGTDDRARLEWSQQSALAKRITNAFLRAATEAFPEDAPLVGVRE